MHFLNRYLTSIAPNPLSNPAKPASTNYGSQEAIMGQEVSLEHGLFNDQGADVVYLTSFPAEAVNLTHLDDDLDYNGEYLYPSHIFSDKYSGSRYPKLRDHL